MTEDRDLELVQRIQRVLDELRPPAMTTARTEVWKAGARAAIRAVNKAISEHASAADE